MSRPLLIDTDPGIDDALALLMAFGHPDVEVVGLCIAAGNVGLSNTVANALKLCEVAGVDVPVFPGCATPLVHAAADASYVHGRDGFGDTGFLPAKRAPESEHAALAMLRLSHRHAGELTLVTLGPMTNLALALRLDPTLPSRIKRLVVMGGAVTGQGNTLVPTEFNIGFDPEAAHVALSAFERYELVDWEAVLRHGLDRSEFEQWLQAGDHRAAFYAAISRQTRDWSADRRGERWLCADALAMALVLEPSHGELDWRPLQVETAGHATRGATVVDWQRRSGRPDSAGILARYDQQRFEALARSALGA
ncbi:nucleoside hydrolase [Alkalisalibacterium limincola]|uniref:Nucleoside hydrolase n=1 Tax=Alkalisalibacterium limincola TaxID=2699169 RepID=A0A5C8KRH0_9GAMM|nr:nucleoside hydrolase [Alkalisalibacterium limincola]TXK62515.1 nucleoside hydrolase [Alkalisalibacterium limincola]